MNIIFVGDMHSTSRALGLVEAMQDLGHRVVSVPPSTFLDADGKPKKLTLTYRIGWKLGFDWDDSRVNERLWEMFIAERPDIVWIYKGTMIRPSVLRQMKAALPSCLLVSYSEDDMYSWRNCTWSYVLGLRHFDVVVTTKSYNVKELSHFGARRVIHVDNSYDKNRRKPVSLISQDKERLGSPVGFVGSSERDRAASMLYLAENGIVVRIWGNGWQMYRGRHRNLRIEGRPLEYGSDGLGYARGICATDINLCFLRKINRDVQTGRSIEIPACRGFMVAERTAEHLRLFEEDLEAVFFDSNCELLSKVRYFLSHPEERLQIAERGHRRCIEEDYSYHGRLKFLLNKIYNSTNTRLSTP